MKRRFTLGLMLALMGLSSSAEALNGGRLIGYGPRARGMGGVSIALPQDAYVGASNPAGLTRVCDRFDIGFDYIHNEGKADIFFSQEDEPQVRHFKSDQDFWYFSGAISYDICNNQSLGLAVVPFGGYKVEFNHAEELFEVGEVGSEVRSYLVTPSWAWQWNSCHSVGVGVNFAFTWTNLKGFQASDTLEVTAFNRYFTNRGDDFEGGFGLSFGWHGQLTDTLMAGFIYHSKIWMNLHKNYKGFYPDTGELDLPSRWGVGLAWCICPTVVLSADLEYVLWTDVSTYGHDGRNQGRFGDVNGPGLGWTNQTIVKAGVAWDVNRCLTLRLGYNYGENPIKGEDAFINVRTLLPQETHITFGGTWYFDDGCSELNLSFVHAFANTLRGSARQQSFQEFFDGRADIQGQDTSVSLSYGRYF